MAKYYLRGKRFWVDYIQDGKRIRRPLKTNNGCPVKDEKIAKYLKNELENALERQDSPFVQLKKAPAKQILEEYRIYCKGIKSDNTIVSDCGSIRLFIEDKNIANINQITPTVVRQYCDNRISLQEINHITANNIIKYLNTFINFAISNSYISKNVILGMKRYKIDKEVIPKFLSIEEINRFLIIAKSERLFLQVAIAIYAGLRYGEIERIDPKYDLVLDKDLVLVRKSKTGRARSIPMHRNLKEILINNWQDILDFTNHQRVFDRIRRKSELPDIDWYTLRHTFASHLVMSGVDIVTVSKLLGHSDIKTTMIYAHLFQDHIKGSIEKLNF